jgi:hypothetical protein
MLTNVDCPLDQANQKHCGNPAGIGVCADCNFDFTYKNANPDDASKRAGNAKDRWDEKRKTKKSRSDAPKAELLTKEIQYKPASSDRVVKNIIEIQPAPSARQSSKEADVARQNEESKAALLKRNEEERHLKDQKVVQSKRDNKLILGAIALFITSLVFFGFAQREGPNSSREKPPASVSECGTCKSPSCVNCKAATPVFSDLDKAPTQEADVDAEKK